MTDLDTLKECYDRCIGNSELNLKTETLFKTMTDTLSEKNTYPHKPTLQFKLRLPYNEFVENWNLKIMFQTEIERQYFYLTKATYHTIVISLFSEQIGNLIREYRSNYFKTHKKPAKNIFGMFFPH